MSEYESPIRTKDAGERSLAAAYVDESGECLVEQSHKDSCDINNIMRKYEQTGQLQHVMTSMPNFGDFESIDFQTAQNAVIQAQDAFMALPAEVRKRFENDPQKFLAFTEDPANVVEMINMGLADAVPNLDPTTLKDVVDAVKSTKPKTKKGASDNSEAQ